MTSDRSDYTLGRETKWDAGASCADLQYIHVWVCVCFHFRCELQNALFIHYIEQFCEQYT